MDIEEQLEILALESPDSDLQLAKDASVHPRIQDVLHERGSKIVICSLMENPSISPVLIETLWEKGFVYRLILAGNPSLPEALKKAACQDPFFDVRLNAATFQALDTEEVVTVLEDSEEIVRSAAASNQALTLAQFEHYSTDLDLIDSLAINPHHTREVKTLLARNPYPQVRKLFAEHLTITSDDTWLPVSFVVEHRPKDFTLLTKGRKEIRRELANLAANWQGDFDSLFEAHALTQR